MSDTKEEMVRLVYSKEFESRVNKCAAKLGIDPMGALNALVETSMVIGIRYEKGTGPNQVENAVTLRLLTQEEHTEMVTRMLIDHLQDAGVMDAEAAMKLVSKSEIKMH